MVKKVIRGYLLVDALAKYSVMHTAQTCDLTFLYTGRIESECPLA